MIEVFLRHCAHSPNSNLPNRNRPEWFDKQKVLLNLLNTIDSNCKITVIFDDYFGEPTLDYSGLSVNRITAGTEAKSFLETLNIVLQKDLPDDTIIYFLEDDYLHQYNWCDIMREAFTMPVKYVTLYDHADKYLHYPDLVSKILTTKSTHWRTTPSTTNTFACKMGQLRSDLDIHRKYSSDREITDDNGKFIELGGVISSIPGYSTHCDDYLSPIINWERFL